MADDGSGPATAALIERWQAAASVCRSPMCGRSIAIFAPPKSAIAPSSRAAAIIASFSTAIASCGRISSRSIGGSPNAGWFVTGNRVLMSAGAHESGVAGRPRAELEAIAQHRVGLLLREQHAVAGDEPAALGKPPVQRDEVRPHDAVAVEKHAVVAARPSSARLRISAARKPRCSCQTWTSGTPMRGFQRSISAAVAGPEPSSATTISKRRSRCAASERSTASSASSRS